MDNIKTWTGLSVEESVRMSEDRDKWRKYVHGVAKLLDRGRLKNRTEQTLSIVRDVARSVLCVCVGLTGESCQNGRTDRDGVCKQTRVDPWFSHTAVRRADH